MEHDALSSLVVKENARSLFVSVTHKLCVDFIQEQLTGRGMIELIGEHLYGLDGVCKLVCPPITRRCILT